MMAATLLAGAVLVAPYGSGRHSQQRKVTGPNLACTSLKKDHVKAVHADGSETDATDGDGLGRRHYYRSTEGGLVPIVVPPKGFDPEKASAQELGTYGYPTRPDTSSPDRREWDRVWGAKPTNAGTEPGGYCEAHGFGLPTTNTPSKATADGSLSRTKYLASSTQQCYAGFSGAMGAPTICYSPNFAGAMGTGGANTYNRANMGWYQTAYLSQSSNSCPNDVYFTWTGFGGLGNRLMQAGTVSAAAAPGTNYNTSAMFWEVLDPAITVPPTYVFAGYQALVNGGDDTHAFASYNDTNHPGLATFTVHDITTASTFDHSGNPWYNKFVTCN